ncbi:Prephenate dehydratase-domain-containing protein [Mycena sp. CBHHK59/15]|nr:Prephenate dehydratase-domain-containing protein [Mycena sp. CBHHK59/15]
MNKEPLKVTFLGPQGTYSHQAAYDRFGSIVEYCESGTITDVFNAVSSGVAHAGIIPQENTIFGGVVETYDALRNPDPGVIRGEIVLEVQHCLLVRRGVKFDEIQRIMSHEQALGQCRGFIAKNFKSASMVKMASTAAAARALLTASNSAAICSKLCATVFDGLDVLFEGIQDQKSNFTRFYVLTASKDVRLPPPSSPIMGQTRCLVRLSSARDPSSPPVSITQLLSALAMTVSRLDRRPQIDNTVPFRDLYFAELERASGVNTDTPWMPDIQQAMDRVRAAGGHIDLLGIW